MLYKRKTSANWWCRFRHGNKEYRCSTETSVRREAEAFERRYRAEMEDKAHDEPRLVATHEGLRDLDVNRARREGRTEQYVRDQISVHWATFARLIPSLEAVDLYAYVAARRAEDITPQTIKKELTTLKRGLIMGRKAGYSIVVPDEWPKLKDADINENRKGHYYGREKTLQFIEGLSGEAKALAVAALLTGLRKTELYRARPDWIELVDYGGINAVLRLPGSKTKSGKMRSVGLGTQAFAAMVCAPFRSAHRRAFKTASKAAGLPRPMHLRDLRHTFATVAAQCGDGYGTSIVMGHSLGDVVGRYQSTDVERLAKIANYVEDWMLGRLQGAGT